MNRRERDRLHRLRAALARAETAALDQRTGLSRNVYAAFGGILGAVAALQRDAGAMADARVQTLVRTAGALEPHNKRDARRLLQAVNRYLCHTLNSRAAVLAPVVALRNGARALVSWLEASPKGGRS